VPEQGERTPALEETLAATPESIEVLEAVRELSARVGGLQADMNALRAQTQPLPAAGGDAPGWDGRTDVRHDTLAWVRDLEGPLRRRAEIPWLLLEITFLAAVAVGAAVADVDWPVVVALMAGAWALVTLAELTAARSARRRAEAAYAPLAIYGQDAPPDPSWFAPPIERTVLDAGDEDTGARLPPAGT
jgi:hypothetical protein